MDPTVNKILIYCIILFISAIIYADSTARDRLEKFLSRCAPLYATIGFSQGGLSIAAGIATIIAFAIPIFFGFFLVGIHGFILFILQLLIFRCFETITLSSYLSRRYIKPFCRDNPDLGKYYQKMFSWLKTNPMAIKKADSEDDLFAQYEQKTGDNSYSEDNNKVIKITDIFDDTINNSIPYNVMNNKRIKSSETSTHHTKKNATSNTETKRKTNSQQNEKPKYCSNCGSRIVDQKGNFCSKCGKKIVK